MKKFVLYTNPNNCTNRAYCSIGASEVNEILKEAKSYPGSYTILFQGKGNDNKIEEMKKLFSNYNF